tara:strand:- start:21909 stop:22613 length:705 start_codon:yes stop_codon:yes gene_type:complete
MKLFDLVSGFLNRINKVIIFFLLIPFISSCQNENKIGVSEVCKNIALDCLKGQHIIEMHTNKGIMSFNLDANAAPITVSNFIELVNNNFYEKKTFDKVIREPIKFTIQVANDQIKNQFIKDNKIKKNSNLIDNNKIRFIPLEIKLKDEDIPRYGMKIKDPRLLDKIELKHTIGSISMARLESVNSASSIFFISLSSLPILDGRYAVFGRIIEGNKVLNIINEGDYIEKIIYINR